MVRSPGTGASKAFGDAGGRSRVVMNKGPWTEAEDEKLSAHVKAHGEGNWRLIPKLAGLARCGKSCRLRWINYLRPNLKRGNFSLDEDNLILTLHALLGNRWSLIAGRIPGRTDNEIKNYWNTHLRRKLRSLGIDPTKYKVGLTLTTDTNPQQINTDFDPSPSPSSPTEPDQLKNHTKTKTTETTETTTTTTTTMANSQLVSSPSNSTSTSTSNESVSGDSVSPGGSELQLQEPWSFVGNSNNLKSSNNPCLVDQGGHVSSGWDYDQFRMEYLQLLDPLEFAGPGTGILQPLEAVAQVQRGKWSTASGSLFDALLD